MAVDSTWLYTNDDHPAMAGKNYDDAKWALISTDLYQSRAPLPAFDGLGWFRKYVYTDTSLMDVPLALTLTHLGASEVYIDGEFYKKFGEIKGKDSCVYHNPQFQPIFFSFKDTGWHVVAIRYANFAAEKNYKRYRYGFAGFACEISRPDDIITHEKTLFIGRSIVLFLFCFFITISMVHLLLFLYYRKELSNLYFSIFAFCIGLEFLYFVIQFSYSSPFTILLSRFWVLPVTCIACFSLSGVINSVFPDKRKTRLYIAGALSLVVAVASFFNVPMLGLGIILLIGLVSLETTIKIIVALIKRRKGSRIIGLGFFLFTFFVLTLMLCAIMMDGIQINDDTILGRTLIVAFILSVLGIPVSMSAYLANSFATVNKDLRKQLEQVKLLSEKTLEQEQEKKRFLESRKEELENEVQVRTEQVMLQKDKIEKQHGELMLEKKKSDDLLLNILPAEVAEELKLKGTSEARYFTDVTVLFTDFVNFTIVSEQLSPQELVSEIHTYFKVFDDIMGTYGLEKIKTIGDAYLAVCGLPEPNANHAVNAVKAAIEIREYITQKKAQGGLFEIRIGLNSGPVVAGIVGVKKFAYDIWGDTVNTAARMEQSSEAGKINISGSTYELIKTDFECTNRGKIDAKNKGMIDMYFVEGEG